MEVTDLVMLDLKQTDSEKHKGTHRAGQRQYFGYGSLLVGDRQADVDPARAGPGLTDDPAELQQLKDFIDSLSSVEKVEILPYHTLGLFKWQNLGIKYPLEGVPVPTPEQVQQAETIRGIAKNKTNGIAILVAMPFFLLWVDSVYASGCFCRIITPHPRRQSPAFL